MSLLVSMLSSSLLVSYIILGSETFHLIISNDIDVCVDIILNYINYYHTYITIAKVNYCVS